MIAELIENIAISNLDFIRALNAGPVIVFSVASSRLNMVMAGRVCFMERIVILMRIFLDHLLLLPVSPVVNYPTGTQYGGKK